MEAEEEEEEEKVRDLTEDEKMSLRRTIYLTIMSSVDFEECCHKILKMNIGLGQEEEVIKLKFKVIFIDFFCISIGLLHDR